MREAKALDWRRRIGECKGWGISLRAISLSAVSTIGTAEVRVERPFSLLCGPNGVGKSSLLQAVWAACDPPAWRESVFRDGRLTEGEVSVDFTIGETVVRCSVDLSNLDSTEKVDGLPEVTFVNAWSEATDYQLFYQEFPATVDLLEGVGEVRLSQADVAALSFLVGKEYREVTLYEVDEGRETTPFFQVLYGDSNYDSRSMGTGEICLFHIWWRLRRSKQGEIILIEEPEAFLSYGSQLSLAKVLAQSVVEKKLCVVTSTHSPAFLEYFQLDQTILVNRGSAGFLFVRGKPRPRLLGQIGVNSVPNTVAFVEDSLAMALLIALLERSDPISRKGVFIDVRNGDGEITSALRSVKGLNLPFRCVGIYDGDLREGIPDDVSAKATYLPFDAGLEIVLKDFIIARVSLLSERLGIDDLSEVLATLEGYEEHEWFGALANDLGMKVGELFQMILPVWLGLPENEQEVSGFQDRLKALLD